MPGDLPTTTVTLWDGIDLDDAFVEIARKKLSRGDVFHDDMSTFAVQRQCDVILCLFSSSGYDGIAFTDVDVAHLRIKHPSATARVIVMDHPAKSTYRYPSRHDNLRRCTDRSCEAAAASSAVGSPAQSRPADTSCTFVLF